MYNAIIMYNAVSLSILGKFIFNLKNITLRK